MNWTAFPVDRMLTAEYLRVSASTRGHHAALILLCAQRENGGRLAGAKAWTNRDWLMSAGCDQRAIKAVVEAGLSAWDDQDLIVLDYDTQRESSLKAQRIANAKAAEVRWSGDAPRIAPRIAPRNPEERRGEEIRETRSGSGGVVSGKARREPDRFLAGFQVDAEQLARVEALHPRPGARGAAAPEFVAAAADYGGDQKQLADACLDNLRAWQLADYATRGDIGKLPFLSNYLKKRGYAEARPQLPAKRVRREDELRICPECQGSPCSVMCSRRVAADLMGRG